MSYENLIFEGGSTRGFAYLGAIKKLDQMGLLSKFKRFAGTSAGSLFAAFLAAGFSADEMMELKDKLDFSSLARNYLLYCYRIFTNYGLHSPDTIRSEFATILSKKVDPEITLSELYKLTGKDLVIVTTCLNTEKGVFLHYTTHPNMKLLDAMICSISIPVVFQPTILKDENGNSNYYVDGGLMDNYPIWVFNDLEALNSGKLLSINKATIPVTTLGLKVLNPDRKNTKGVFIGRKDINSIEQFFCQIINTMMMQVERSDVSESYIKQTIPINTGNISILDFELTTDQIDNLMKIGSDSVVNYFNKTDY